MAGEEHMMEEEPAPPPKEPRLAKPRGRSRSRKKEVKELEKLFTDQDVKDTECGLGPCKASWMQALAFKESLIVLYSLAAIVQGMFFTYTVAVISTIEKRFRLTSKHTGIMLAGNDISAVLLAVFLGYYGNAGHRPRWLGAGLLLTALSSLVAALPHFIYGAGPDAHHLARHLTNATLTNFSANTTEDGIVGEELCFSGTNHSCEKEEEEEGREPHLGPPVLIFVSQFVVGVSMSIFYSVGISFVDDNINKRTTSFYYSIYLLLRLLGPVLGFMVGGKCLSLWINPSLHPHLSEKDPRWLGAWWLGYLLISGLLVVLGWVMALLPRKLPATLRREVRTRLRSTQEGTTHQLLPVLVAPVKAREKTSLKNMLARLKRLSRNRVWTANVFNTVFAVLATSGYKVFKPKYLEQQFRKSASEANYYTGMATMVATTLGTVLSAGILRWVRPGPRYVVGYNVLATCITCAGYLVLMFVGCPEVVVVSSSTPAAEEGLGDDQSAGGSCWSECGCSGRFQPVCSEDLTTVYYSPCYAGCSLANTSAAHTVYSECRCIPGNLTWHPSEPLPPTAQRETVWGSATQGYCPQTCHTFVYYIVIQIFMDTVYSLGKIGSTLIHLRSVEDKDKGLALGVLEVCIALFGFIPAPVIMGAIIDSSCVVWNTSCGESGNCWLYDTYKLRMITHLVPAGLVLVSVAGDLVMFHYSHLLDLYGERDDHTEATHPGTHETTQPGTHEATQPGTHEATPLNSYHTPVV